MSNKYETNFDSFEEAARYVRKKAEEELRRELKPKIEKELGEEATHRVTPS